MGGSWGFGRLRLSDGCIFSTGINAVSSDGSNRSWGRQRSLRRFL